MLPLRDFSKIKIKLYNLYLYVPGTEKRALTLKVQGAIYWNTMMMDETNTINASKETKQIKNL